jgi:hypothetical protein
MNRTAHFYWGGGPLSWLRYLTILTFRRRNPAWRMVMHRPRCSYDRAPEWPDPPHKRPYRGHDHFAQALRACDECRTHDLRAEGFRDDVPEAFKSDWLRWQLLDREGGFWADMDIVWLDGLPESEFRGADLAISALKDPAANAPHWLFFIGYIWSVAGNPMMRWAAKEAARHLDPENYQSIGTLMLSRQYRSEPDIHAQHPDMRFRFIPPETYLPIRWDETGKLLERTAFDLAGTIGLHWFGGSEHAHLLEEALGPHNCQDYDCCVAEVVRAALTGSFTELRDRWANALAPRPQEELVHALDR